MTRVGGINWRGYEGCVCLVHVKTKETEHVGTGLQVSHIQFCLDMLPLGDKSFQCSQLPGGTCIVQWLLCCFVHWLGSHLSFCQPQALVTLVFMICVAGTCRHMLTVRGLKDSLLLY